ncbi:diphthine methyltransferase [Drosophila rhopaloa]|uniref:methylated diphthine methylhydrolase n=1 Tax=Drosophila rhopaloa TaxID=1041015 RepID=A0A6P4ECL6_DRORH|nr:diphthine methyltransferase [Drosophila rhopaloa]
MFTTLHSEDTEYSADSVEWLPEDDPETGFFACGTYQLVQDDAEAPEEASPKGRPRKGRVYLYQFGNTNSALERLQCIETSAILDMKWLPAWSGDGNPLLSTVNSLGQLEIYQFLRDDKKLQKRTCFSLEEEAHKESPLALALDWRQEEQHIQLAISDSKGGLNLLKYSPQGEVIRERSWSAHGFEAWTCAFDRWSPHLLYSGGDDMLLMAHDLRTEQRAWTNRAHMAGVTCLLSHPKHENHLLTGSYDEQLRLFDTRAMKRTLAELDLGGGIWRLKPHPAYPDLILAACMYTNFSLVQLDAKDPSLCLLGAYEEHKSICYGADWGPGSNKDDGALIMGTCSFYDHKLCVSRVEIGK